MKHKIQAGMLADVTNFIKTLSDTFFKFIDKFGDWGIQVVDSEETDAGGVWMKLSYNGIYVECTATPVGGKDGIFDVTIKPSGKTPINLSSIKESEIESKVTDALKQAFGSDFTQNNTTASRTMRVSLSKIVAADSINVELKSIYADYDITDAVSNLYSIVDDSGFVDQLTEEPQSFEIVENVDDFDITSIPDFDVSSTPTQLFYAAVRLWSIVKELSWYVRGPMYTDFRNVLNDYHWRLVCDMDCFGELSIELTQTAPSIPDAFNDMYTHPNICGCVESSNCQLLRDAIQTYIDTIDVLYVNVAGDVQTQLCEIMRFWKHEVDYTLSSCI